MVAVRDEERRGQKGGGDPTANGSLKKKKEVRGRNNGQLTGEKKTIEGGFR